MVGRQATKNLFPQEQVSEYGLAGFNDEFDSGPLFPIDHDVGKRRDADEVNAVGRYEASSDGHCLYSLVESPRADCLHFSSAALSEHACQGTCHRVGVGLC